MSGKVSETVSLLLFLIKFKPGRSFMIYELSETVNLEHLCLKRSRRYFWSYRWLRISAGSPVFLGEYLGWPNLRLLEIYSTDHRTNVLEYPPPPLRRHCSRPQYRDPSPNIIPSVGQVHQFLLALLTGICMPITADDGDISDEASAIVTAKSSRQWK